MSFKHKGGGDSMIFDMNHVPPVARGQECDIDSLL